MCCFVKWNVSGFRRTKIGPWVQILGKLFYNSKGLTEQNAQDKIVFMLSAMNEDNLSCAFCFINISDRLLPRTSCKPLIENMSPNRDSAQALNRRPEVHTIPHIGYPWHSFICRIIAGLCCSPFCKGQCQPSTCHRRKLGSLIYNSGNCIRIDRT